MGIEQYNQLKRSRKNKIIKNKGEIEIGKKWKKKPKFIRGGGRTVVKQTIQAKLINFLKKENNRIRNKNNLGLYNL